MEIMRTKEENDRIAYGYLRSGMSQQEYAAKIGIPRRTLTSILANRDISANLNSFSASDRREYKKESEFSDEFRRAFCDRFVEERKKDRSFSANKLCAQYNVSLKFLYRWLKAYGYDKPEWVNTANNFNRYTKSVAKLEDECPLLKEITIDEPVKAEPAKEMYATPLVAIEAGGLRFCIYEEISDKMMLSMIRNALRA